MTNDDKEALKEFLSGFLLVCGMIAVFFILFYVMSGGTKPSSERFKVVDKYNNCDVVRYSPGNTATYKYFLDCK